MNVDLFLFLIPVHLGVEHTHAPLLELEFIYPQVGTGSKIVEEIGGCRLACGLTAELDGVKVHEVEDVSYLYLVQVDRELICLMLRGDAVDDDVLLSMFDGEVVDEQAVLMVDDVGGLNVPQAVVEQDA